MRNNWYKKSLVIGIIVLFIGISVISSSAINLEQLSSTKSGNTLYVGGSGPGNYTTIRQALQNVTTGDTIYVYDDSAPYYENWLFIDKTIQLIGENKTTTTIDSVEGLTIFTIEADGVTISGFNLINSSHDGIWIEGVSHCSIYDNIISDHAYGGIMLWGHSSYNTICDNIVNGCVYGIYMYWYSQHNTIHHNEINGNGYGIIMGYDSNYNHVSNNSGYGNSYGIHIYQNADHNTFINNQFEAGSHHPWYGIMIQGSSKQNTIIQNTFIKYDYGAYVWISSNNNIFSKNNFLRSKYYDVRDECSNIWDLGYDNGGNFYSMYTGIDADEDGIGDTPQTIPGGSNIDNYPLKNPYGSIQNIDTKTVYRTIQYAIDAITTLAGHTILLQEHTYFEHVEITKAIHLIGTYPTDVIIDGSLTDTPIILQTNNVVISHLQIQHSGTQTTDSGIHITTDNNIICKTTVTACNYGIRISQGFNNQIYHTNFINNIQHAWDNSINTWDDGYPSGGNYWDDYTGTDSDGDGIGDTPYHIPGGSNEDHYPYMMQNGWENHAPTSPIITGPTICAVDRSYDYSFISTDEDTDDIAYFIYWGDNTSTGWTSYYPSGKTITLNHKWHQTGTFHIIARAKDTHQVHSMWTNPFIVTVVENDPPDKPSITGTQKGTVGETYDYTVQTTDPDGNDLYYWIDWGDETNTGWVGPVPSGQSITMNHSWSVKGTYIITAKAKDSLQEESAWGELIIRMPLNIKHHHMNFLSILYIKNFLQHRFNTILLWLYDIMNQCTQLFQREEIT